MDRPAFNAAKRRASEIEYFLATGKELKLKENGLAQPHRLSYKSIRDMILNGTDRTQIAKRVNHLLKGSKEYETAFDAVDVKDPDIRGQFQELKNLYRKTREDVENALGDYLTGGHSIQHVKNQYKPVTLRSKKTNNNTKVVPSLQKPSGKGLRTVKRNSKEALIYALNNLASNAPGAGPQEQNGLVSHRNHINTDKDGSRTPRSEAADSASVGLGIKTATSSKNGIPGTLKTDGSVGKLPDNLPADLQHNISFDEDWGIHRGALKVKNGKVFKPDPHNDTEWLPVEPQTQSIFSSFKSFFSS